MLRFSAEQIDALRAVRLAAFRAALALRLEATAPDLAATLTPEQRRAAAEAACADASEHGFTLKGPLRLWLDACVALGSGFARDPQYPDPPRLLAGEGEEMRRAEALHAWITAHLEAVDGPDNLHTVHALRRLRAEVDAGAEPQAARFARDMLDLFARVHPRKTAASGEAALAALIETTARRAAREHGFRRPEEGALACALAFAFGAGFDRDPLLPWIARTLDAGAGGGPSARAARLKRRALVWLDAVLEKRRDLA